MKVRKEESKYTQEQLREYLDRIQWTGSPPRATYGDLKKMQQSHMINIPFCNSFITYEQDSVGLDQEALFKRLVTDRGAFFCFGQNLLFREMLRAVGFRCFTSLARVNAMHSTNDEMRMEGVSHMTIFVALNDNSDEPDDDHLYLTDVGFGGLAITQPLPLRLECEQPGALNIRHRVGIREHPESSISMDATAVKSLSNGVPLGAQVALEHRTYDDKGEPLHPWRANYLFLLTECFQKDYDMLHLAVSTKSWLFTHNVLAARYIPAEKEGDPLGMITLFRNTIKIRKHGAQEQVITLNTEAERIAAIREHFGIHNLPADAEKIIRSKGIEGLALAA